MEKMKNKKRKHSLTPTSKCEMIKANAAWQRVDAMSKLMGG
jgi:hypothetical protein